jgi:hypothetical protein
MKKIPSTKILEFGYICNWCAEASALGPWHRVAAKLQQSTSPASAIINLPRNISGSLGISAVTRCWPGVRSFIEASWVGT